MYMKTREDQQQVLREAWRVLKPAGRLSPYQFGLEESDYAPPLQKRFSKGQKNELSIETSSFMLNGNRMVRLSQTGISLKIC
jgi:ubiquinone/menaquinone biosynthesis C-methylase UbiE